MEVEMQNAIILINHNGMGQADETLQQALIGKYIELTLLSKNPPNAICFYADGVKLVVEDSPVLDQLLALEKQGVRLLVCNTCLKYFNILEKVKVGIVAGMGDILEAQQRADKVITI